MSKFSDMFSYLRKQNNLTQEELAVGLGIARSTVGSYEAGLREPNFDTLEAIADFFNVTVSTLLGESDKETVGSRIALRRKQLGLTQGELAQKMGYKSKSSINKIELGINDISSKAIYRFAEVLGVEPTWLIGVDAIDGTSIAKKILQAMSEKNMSYADLSTRTGIPKSALQRYATGVTEKIPLQRAESIAQALGFSPSALMGWEKNTTPSLTEKQKKILELLERLTDKQLDALIALFEDIN